MLRGCTGSVAHGPSFQERERGTVGSAGDHGALALLPIATADPSSWGRQSALPEQRHLSGKRLSRRQKFVLEKLIFVGRLCKTCVSSGYKILGSEPEQAARQSLKKFLAFDGQ
jgi:hypothetical protein